MDPDLTRWLDVLRGERAFSPHSIRAYAGDLEGLAHSVRRSGRTLRQASLQDLRRWLGTGAGAQLDDLAPSTVARRIGAVRSFYRWMVREGVLDRSPAERLSSPKVARAVPRFLEIPEAAEVVEDPTQDGALGLRNQALLELLYGAGLRVGEAVALNWAQVDLDGRLVRVLGKGDKERMVPFGPPAAEALAAWAAAGTARPGAAVFLNRDGGRLSARSAWRIARDAGAKNGIAGVHPHVLRHSCATHMLTGGADLRGIQEQLGHASLSTTQRYTHVDAAHLLSVYRAAHPHARADDEPPAPEAHPRPRARG